MCLAHSRCYIEWKNSVLGNCRMFASRTFQIIWLGMPPSKRRLFTAIFTATAELTFEGDPQCSLFRFPCCGASVLPKDETSLQGQHTYGGLLSCPLPFSGIPIQGKKILWASYLFFSQCFSRLSGSLKWINIVFRKAALTVGCCQVGLGYCQELVWHPQLGLVLSCWPQAVWQNSSWKTSLWPGCIETKEDHSIIMTEYKWNTTKHKMNQTFSDIKNGRSDCHFFTNHSLVLISWS